MPYCCQCGNAVRTTDRFCAVCGNAQNPISPAADPLQGLSPRTASLLCYVPFMGWLGSVIVLASAKFRYDRTVRFHAFQGLYLFVAYLILEIFISPFVRHSGNDPMSVPLFRPILSMANLVLLATWIFMLIKTSQGVTYHLPVLGEMAEKSVAEQA